VRAEGHNPLCGDRVRVELLVEQGTVRSAAFTANACALCTAAASLLTEHAMGATVARVAAFSDDDALAWLETTVPSGREACATLPLRALRQVLDRQLQPAPRA
jgi:nitrogen fixation protein NifU and related proteins